MKQTVSAQFAAFSRAFGARPLAPEDGHQVARSWVDTLSVALPGWNEPAARRALAYAERQASALPDRLGARLWGRPERASAETAALLNGIAAHVLDYDDVTSPLRGHPSVALWPALMALADARDLPGDRLARAFCVGFELICRLSRAMAQRHYARGWHSTSSIGTLGAALACAHLLDLSEAQTVSCLGLAVAQCGGTRQNFGTDAKSFQAGMCGAAGVRAALLAESGFEASALALDGPFGYQALYAPDETLEHVADGLGQDRLELHASGFEIKQYPLCYATHRTIDGILALRREHAIALEDVETVEIVTSAGALVPLIHHRPGTGLQGKFSMEYAVAAALADGHVRLGSFTDAAVQRPSVQTFLARVTAREVSGTLLPRYAEIAVHLKDGRRLACRVDTQHGAAEDPLTQAELAAKAGDCLAAAGVRTSVDDLTAAAAAMPDAPARRLLDVLA